MRIKHTSCSPLLAATLLFLLAGVLTPHRPADAVLLTGNRLNSCVQQQYSTNAPTKVCRNRQALKMAMANGESVSIFANYSGYPQGITYKVSKSEPVWNYPLRYLHTVDYAPREELIKVVNSRPGIASCVDGSDSVAPTCGWQPDGGNNRIADSQGFCSNRDLLTLKNCSPGDDWWRGEKELGSQSTLAASFSIAHCLRMSGVSYQGYEIDPPVREFSVTIDAYDGETLLRSLSLSPDKPRAADAPATTNPLQASLVGKEFTAPPPLNLSGYILYIPSAPANDPKVIDWVNNLLLVPREMVSRDGRDCNRVGSDYSAFRKEAAFAAKSVAGACLGNQLQQLHTADLAKLAANPAAETDYLVRGKQLFKAGLAEMATLERPALLLKSPELARSTVALEMDPAAITLEPSERSAWIWEATLAPHSSLSREGLMKVRVENTGSSASDYMVTLHDCAPGIEQISPQIRSLAGHEIATFTFPIRSNINMEGSHYCWVTLQSPQTTRVYDELQVFFDTHPLVDKLSQQLLLKNTSSTVKTP